VYHLAAYAAEGLSHFIKRFNYENNVLGSVNLINAAVNYDVRCFVFTSSIAVYGAAQLPMTEDQTPRPEDPYGIAKHAVEQELECSSRMFGLNSIIFRPHNVYGEFQNIGDRYRNVIGIFMNQIMRGEPLTIFGDGTQTRAFSYVKEISGIIADCVNVKSAYGQVFNIGAETPYSVNHLAHEVSNVFGVEPRINYLPARNEVRHAFSSSEKIRGIFHEVPTYSLREGLKLMSRWAKTHGPRISHASHGCRSEITPCPVLACELICPRSICVMRGGRQKSSLIARRTAMIWSSFRRSTSGTRSHSLSG
jgi:UDP-glucose 4-epimerase